MKTAVSVPVPVQVHHSSSVLKACKRRSSSPPQLPFRRTTTLVGPLTLTTTAATEIAKVSPSFSPSYGNPCLDLFFLVKPPRTNTDTDTYTNSSSKTETTMPVSSSSSSWSYYSHNYLKKLLPLAWSNNPLTTLKLICNLLDGRKGTGKDDREGFYTAAYWLYQNHPNTLACNLLHIASSFASFPDLLELLYRALEGQEQEDVVSGSRRRRRTREDLKLEISRGDDFDFVINSSDSLAMAKKTLERYRIDPNFRLLHEAISDLYAHCLNSDIQNLNNFHMIDESQNKCLEITSAAKWCPYVDSSYDRATLLCESIAKKVFPRGGDVDRLQLDAEAEADYAYKVRQRLRKEVLVPLMRVLEEPTVDDLTGSNRWGYNPVAVGFKPEPCAVKTYLEDVKAGKIKELAPDALLPNEIVCYAHDEDVEEAAELQWNAMVDDIYLKQGKLKSSLVVCDLKRKMKMNNEPACRDAGVALALLTSQLNEEPWKGKFISYSGLYTPELHSIQGDDLKSKCEFVRSLDIGWDCDSASIMEVFDLILEVAVKGNLKPEQMIKRVFVFSSDYEYDPDKSEEDKLLETFQRRYNMHEIRKKFEDQGYEDVVPEVRFWDLRNPTMFMPSTKQGGKLLGGFSYNVFKTFLDRDGVLVTEDAMEAAIAGQEYQDLAVVD